MNECPFFNDLDFQEAWLEHREVRRKKRGSLTERADRYLLKRMMDRCNNNKEVCISALDRAAVHGWIDVYPDHEPQRQQGKLL